MIPSKMRIVDYKKKKVPGEIIQELLRHFTTSFGIAYATIEESQPHWHNHTVEWYLVTKGRGRVFVDDTIFHVAKGDLLCIPPRHTHFVKKQGKTPLEFIVVSSPAWNQNDHHLVRAE